MLTHCRERSGFAVFLLRFLPHPSAVPGKEELPIRLEKWREKPYNSSIEILPRFSDA